MTKLTVSSIALAAALALSMPLTSANAADPAPSSPMNEQHLDAKNAYQNALTDCELKDNPDRRQQCKDQAMKEYEQAQKSGMKDSGKEKSKY